MRFGTIGPGRTAVVFFFFFMYTCVLQKFASIYSFITIKEKNAQAKKRLVLLMVKMLYPKMVLLFSLFHVKGASFFGGRSTTEKDNAIIAEVGQGRHGSSRDVVKNKTFTTSC